MNKNNSFKEIYEKIQQSNNILLSLHRGPDGDSLGSCTSMSYFLKKLRKNVKIISCEKLARNFLELSFSREIEFEKSIEGVDLDNFDLFISLDMSNKEMLTKNKNFEFPENLFIINIDHHEKNPYFGNLNYVDERETSTCSILLEFFKNLNIEFDKELSTRLLLGICTDSMFFKTRHAKEALKQASELIDKKGDYYFVLDNILLKENLNLKKFFAIIVNNLKKYKNFGYSLVFYDEIKNLELTNSEIRLGTSEISFINEFDFVFTLVETSEGIKGGLRSNYGFDVSKIARKLGGAGHKSAAGFFLPKIPLKQAEKKVLDAIEELNIQ